MASNSSQFTIAQIIQIAKVSQYLYNYDAANGSLFGPRIDPMRGIKLYVIRKDIEDVYNYDQSYPGLVQTSKYLLGLCDTRAQAVVAAGGGTVIPGTINFIKSPIMITGSMFATSLGWEGANTDGLVILPSYSLQVFWNGLNRYLIQGYEWTRTSKGFDIIVNGVTITAFDALGANATDIFFISISA